MCLKGGVEFAEQARGTLVQARWSWVRSRGLTMVDRGEALGGVVRKHERWLGGEGSSWWVGPLGRECAAGWALRGRICGISWVVMAGSGGWFAAAWVPVRVVGALPQQLSGFGWCHWKCAQLLGIGLGRGCLFYFALSNDFARCPSGHPRNRGLVFDMLTSALGVALWQCRVARTSLLFHSSIVRPSEVGVGDKYILGLVHLVHLADFVAGYQPVFVGVVERLEI
jgi:hypothetical protein